MVLLTGEAANPLRAGELAEVINSLGDGLQKIFLLGLDSHHSPCYLVSYDVKDPQHVVLQP